jgi:hypothetical protein
MIWIPDGGRKIVPSSARLASVDRSTENTRRRIDEHSFREDTMPRRKDTPEPKFSTLWEAVFDGTLADVNDFLSRGGIPEEREEEGDPTPLMRAAELGRLDVVPALVEAGADVDDVASDTLDWSDLPFLEAVFQSGTFRGMSALAYAVAYGHPEVADYLACRTSADLLVVGTRYGLHAPTIFSHSTRKGELRFSGSLRIAPRPPRQRGTLCSLRTGSSPGGSSSAPCATNRGTSRRCRRRSIATARQRGSAGSFRR